MNKLVSVKWYSNGLMIYQHGVKGCLAIPNELKTHFYENLLTACINHNDFDYTDLEGDTINLHMDYKKHFNTFLNGMYFGDLSYVLLNEYSVALPIETNDTIEYFEVYDSRLMECYLLEKEEILN